MKKLPRLRFQRFHSSQSLSHLISAQVMVDDMSVYASKNSIGNVVNFKLHATLVAAVEVAGLISVMDRILLPG